MAGSRLITLVYLVTWAGAHSLFVGMSSSKKTRSCKIYTTQMKKLKLRNLVNAR